MTYYQFLMHILLSVRAYLVATAATADHVDREAETGEKKI